MKTGKTWKTHWITRSRGLCQPPKHSMPRRHVSASCLSELSPRLPSGKAYFLQHRPVLRYREHDGVSTESLRETPSIDIRNWIFQYTSVGGPTISPQLPQTKPCWNGRRRVRVRYQSAWPLPNQREPLPTNKDKCQTCKSRNRVTTGKLA